MTKRASVIQLRVSSEEKRAIERNARAAGKPAGTFLRELGVGRVEFAPDYESRPEPPKLPTLWKGSGRWECRVCRVRNDIGGACPRCGEKMLLGFGS